jgi:hypothetical protein
VQGEKLMLRTSKYFYLFLLVLAILAVPSATTAQIAVGISVHIGPPALPVYAQPVCPGVGYMWTPGYWAYGPDGYYWVPGTWVMAPRVGLLWTPGYWGWGGGAYMWHGGYWGPHVGFYGGINYGFGYGGVGFGGGEWRGGAFHYNTAVTNVNTTVIHNTYVNKTVINNNTTVNRTSFNGGTGGVTAQPTAAERAAEQEKHTPATSLQTKHEEAARSDKSMLASANHGQPAVAATAKPGEFHGKGVVAARPAGENGNAKAAVKTDRPPSAQTSKAASSNTNKTNATNTSHANTKSSSAIKPETKTSNTQHTNKSQTKSSKPPKSSHPAESHEHQSSGKPGGRGR